MKKYTLLYSAVVALALVSCDYNEDNFDGFEDFGKEGEYNIHRLGFFER